MIDKYVPNYSKYLIVYSVYIYIYIYIRCSMRDLSLDCLSLSGGSGSFLGNALHHGIHA